MPGDLVDGGELVQPHSSAIADQLQKAEAAHEAASRRYEQAREKRNATIRAAIAAGWTNAQVAKATGLTRGRIAQIAPGLGP